MFARAHVNPVFVRLPEQQGVKPLESLELWLGLPTSALSPLLLLWQHFHVDVYPKVCPLLCVPHVVSCCHASASRQQQELVCTALRRGRANTQTGRLQGSLGKKQLKMYRELRLPPFAQWDDRSTERRRLSALMAAKAPPV